MLNRVTELFPAPLVKALLPLGKMEPPWLYVEKDGVDHFTVKFRTNKVPDILSDVTTKANEWLMQFSLSRWLAHGPKIARPSLERCEAMAQIEVRLQMDDLAFPYPEVLVALPEIMFPRYQHVLLSLTEDRILVGSMIIKSHADDVVSVIRQRDEPGWTIETTLDKYEEDCANEKEECHRAMRVALNCCMLMTNRVPPKPVLEAEYHRDRHLSKENSDRGMRAKERAATAMQLVEFDHTVEYVRVERKHNGAGEPTGKEKPPHWRRGHWRMQACGPKLSERKRILIPPVMVRPDLFAGDVANTTTQYVDR